MYQSSKTTREKYTYQINAFNVWLDKNKISEEYVTKDDAEKYLLEEIIGKKLSKSKLQISVAALNFRFDEVEKKFKLKATKYKGGENK